MQRSLRSRVLGLAGLAVLGAAAALALVARQTLNDIERDISQARLRVAETLASQAGRDVVADLETLQGVRAAPGIDLSDDDSGPEQRALASAVRNLRVADAVCFASPQGRVLSCEPSTERSGINAPIAARILVAAVAAERPVVTPFFDVGGRRESLAIVPIVPFDRDPEGAVVGLIDANHAKLLTLLPAPAGLTVGIFDTSGTSALQAPFPKQWTEAPIPGTSWIVRTADAAQAETDPVAELRHRELWAAPLLTLIAMLLAWGLSVSVTRPVATLTRAAERIAAGDLSQPIAGEGRDEIGRLAAALEEMRSRLKQSLESVQRRLLRRVMAAQEDERRRVARELHDETSQLVAALGIGLQTAAATTPAPAKRTLTDLIAVVDRMHDGLHRIIVNLRPSVLDDLGLDAAIHWLADHQLGEAGIASRCELHGLDDCRLPPEVETTVFRAVQEALTNCARHSGASSVLIQGGIEAGRLWIEIEDDGEGFDVEQVHPGGDSLRGIGLLGMRERLELVGGTVHIDSALGQGTRVSMEMPVAISELAGAHA